MAIGSSTSLISEDSAINEEELAAKPSGTQNLPLTAHPCLGCKAKESGGWQEVLHWHGPRSKSPAPVLPSCPIPAWLSGRCCRCLAHGHCAAVCRDPFRCSRYLDNGHHAHECHNPWRPFSSLACLFVRPMSFHGVVHRHAPDCVDSAGSLPPSKALQHALGRRLFLALLAQRLSRCKGAWSGLRAF
jgi:hypothetical protein